MDKISIINLKIPARHGVYDFEKDKDGMFELDVEMYTDLSKSGNSDKLSDTVNYDEAIGVVTEIFQREDYNLVEAVGEDICTGLLSKYSIEKVVVRIRKPHAPIMANLDTVEVELIRTKNEF